MKNCVLLVLHDRKDITVNIISPEAKAWIESDWTGGRQTANNEQIPVEVIKSLALLHPDEDLSSLARDIHITTGSYDNDRMLHLSPALQSFESVTEAFHHAQANGIYVLSEIYGLVY